LHYFSISGDFFVYSYFAFNLFVALLGVLAAKIEDADDLPALSDFTGAAVGHRRYL